MATLLLVPAGVPMIVAAVYAAWGVRRGTAWLAAASAAVVLASAIALAVRAVAAPVTGLGGLLRVDALGAYMLIVIGAVSLLAALAAPSYLAGEGVRERRRYGLLTQAFVAAMALAVLAASLGVAWVAIEATTVVTAFLVGHRRTRNATEAAWKYVVICSAGVALAFLGITLLYFAARHAGLPESGTLDWATLAAHGAGLDPAVTRVAVALLVIGFGAKAGLAPLHAWLPDAHSQAPAPVSALMSGVLLSVAFYAVLRVKIISDVALGTGLMRVMLLTMGLVSIAIAAALLIAQRDYKRMLAYSSIEHLGLIAVAAAIGSRLALTGMLLHILGHGLAKAVAFLATGHIHHLVRRTRISALRGLTGWAPGTAFALAGSLLALLGFPPFSTFAGQLAIFRAGFAGGLAPAVVAALILLLVAMAALTTHASRMLLRAPRAEPAGPPARTPAALTAAFVLGLAGSAVLGVSVGPLETVLRHAAAILGGLG